MPPKSPRKPLERRKRPIRRESNDPTRPFRERRGFHRHHRVHEAEALRDLERLRAPLLMELDVLHAGPDYLRGQPPHRSCTKEFNQMRISPLEARAIAEAFKRDPELRAKLPAVLARLRQSLRSLEDNEERQSFDCPLLEGTRCLVHRIAKPIGCLAWHPRAPGDRGPEFQYTKLGWESFSKRDALNDRVYGKDWKLRAIPLWLRRVFGKGSEKRVDRWKGRRSGGA
jgi:hypothetical protein